MGRWETFDHTADVGLIVTATDLDDLFRTAAEALFDYIVVNRSEVRKSVHDEIRLASDDTAELLACWLNELIYLSETKHLLFTEFQVTVSPDGRSLVAVISGEPVDRDRHELDHEVKAVTRHGLELDRAEDGNWVARLILDI